MRDARFLREVEAKRAAEQVAALKHARLREPNPEPAPKPAPKPKVPAFPALKPHRHGKKVSVTLYLEIGDWMRLSELRERTQVDASSHIRDAVLQYLAHPERQMRGADTVGE